MTENITPNIFPTLRYRDADAALQWLTQAFGFTEHAVYRNDEGVIEHAELKFGSGMIMFGQHRDDGFVASDGDPRTSPVGLYVVVDDPDAHHARAVAAGAEIVRDLSDQSYGSRDYSARDLDGNLWSFGTYSPLTGNTAPSIFPTLRYRDADAALDWLTQAFGLTEHSVHRDDAGVIVHAELKFGSGMIMFGQHRDDGFVDPNADPKTSPLGLYVVVDDPDAHHTRAVAAGAEIVRGLEDQTYGSRDYGARDLDGNQWWFGTYSPAAVQAQPATA